MASAAAPDNVSVKRAVDDADCENEPTSKKVCIESTEGSVSDECFSFSDKPTLRELSDLQQQFIRERNWDQFHPPRNVLLAMIGEIGELAEIFQWKGEVKEGVPEFTPDERVHLGQELSDVFFHLTDLAVRCRVDLPKVALEKLQHNRDKYPVAKAYGSCKKYTALQ